MIRLHFDAGHGGNDCGACGNGLKEKDITLAVCLKVQEKLRDYKDVEVFQTRTTDITQSLSQKSSIVNAKANLDFCLSIHVNAAGGVGGEIWLQGAYGDAYSYAKTIINEYCSYTGARNRGVKIGDLHMNREVYCNSNLIELAFIDSPSSADINLLKDIDRMAQGVVNGLVKCFNLVKKTNSSSSASDYKVGDKIKVSTSATHYATGQAMASFVKGSTYTVKQVNSDRVLLSEIMSWVYKKDISLVSSTSNNFTPYKVKITADVLNVRADATTNSKIVTTVKKNEVYTIVGEKNNFLKLKSGSGYIHKDYTVKY